MTANRTQRQVVITRTFNAPRDLVWQMWTVPEHFKQWWGPKNSTTSFCTIDLRVGGEIRFAEKNPDGTDLWQKGVYMEILPGERIVYTHSFADAEGKAVPGSYYGIPSDWLALEVTVSLRLWATRRP